MAVANLTVSDSQVGMVLRADHFDGTTMSSVSVSDTRIVGQSAMQYDAGSQMEIQDVQFVNCTARRVILGLLVRGFDTLSGRNIEVRDN